MPGAGSYYAGGGPAGAEPATSLVLAPPVPFQAPFIDPVKRDVAFQSNGSVVSVHPVDQEVVLALLIAENQITSVPEQGQTVTQIAYLDKALSARVTDAVTRALGTLLAAGDIDLRSVTVDEQWDDGFVYTVTYVNLRQLGAEPSSITNTVLS